MSEVKPVYLDIEHLENMYLQMRMANERNMKEKFEALDKIAQLTKEGDMAVKGLEKSNTYLELFVHGQKRMRHDLNLSDTMDAVKLYHENVKLLTKIKGAK